MARTLSRYSTIAILLHWLIAVLILANIGLAWTFKTTPQGLTWFKLIQLHKSIGITVLMLSVLRLVWRLVNPPPPLPPTVKPWEILIARLVHWGFYGIMIGMPLTGWAMVSASTRNLPTVLFGVAPWPHIGFIHALPLDARKVWSHWSETGHGLLAWLAYGLIMLHLSAVLKHTLIDRDPVLGRMAPFLARGAKPDA